MKREIGPEELLVSKPGYLPKGSMNPNSIYFGLTVVPIWALWDKVYTIWALGPLGVLKEYEENVVHFKRAFSVRYIAQHISKPIKDGCFIGGNHQPENPNQALQSTSPNSKLPQP